MKEALIVGLGGMIGTLLRFGLGQGVSIWFEGWRFPVGTFVINIIGCLIIGVVAGIEERYQIISSPLRPFVYTGLLGGFTTFSAFGLEGVSLMRKGLPAIAVLYVLLSVLVGLAAVWLGMRLVK